MDTYLSSLLCLAAGGLFLVRNLSHLLNETQLRCYLQRSPKAKLWVNYFGFDRTFCLAQKLLLPLGCVVGCCLILLGCWDLLRLSGL
ncbi:hypothetical protein HR45_15665 [Shewanella mangrovi]|uniref:Uncharacterized protein n=1 Tax=Shewanella mangrovi TaxID=1515746 RepID=A0A094JEU6_9GAMM|nr:hypothetical protein [Shewanella mangrovi]KFZ36569.1 hypothetical protein HR45_15665 [Shewanella mangrovi]